jgi:hypothetical protein
MATLMEGEARYLWGETLDPERARQAAEHIYTRTHRRLRPQRAAFRARRPRRR